jgi:hypothetical protein
MQAACCARRPPSSSNHGGMLRVARAVAVAGCAVAPRRMSCHVPRPRGRRAYPLRSSSVTLPPPYLAQKNARPPRMPACHRYRHRLFLLLQPPPLPLSWIYPSVLIALKGFAFEGFGCLLGSCLVYSVI